MQAVRRLVRAGAPQQHRGPPTAAQWPRLSSGGGSGKDEFDSFGFDDEDAVLQKDARDKQIAEHHAVEEAAARKRAAAEDASKMTPAMARDMVDKLVRSISHGGIGRTPGHPGPSAHSTGPHGPPAQTTKPWEEKEAVQLTLDAATLRVLTATRFESYRVHSAGRSLVGQGQYPIESAVVARVDVAALGLSEVARAALEKIVEWPRRYNKETGEIKVRASHHVLAVENKIYLTQLLGRLVREARASVGEDMGEAAAPRLDKWVDVVKCADEAMANVRGGGGDATEVGMFLQRELGLIEKDQVMLSAAAEATATENARQLEMGSFAPESSQLDGPARRPRRDG